MRLPRLLVSLLATTSYIHFAVAFDRRSSPLLQAEEGVGGVTGEGLEGMTVEERPGGNLVTTLEGGEDEVRLEVLAGTQEVPDDFVVLSPDLFGGQLTQHAWVRQVLSGELLIVSQLTPLFSNVSPKRERSQNAACITPAGGEGTCVKVIDCSETAPFVSIEAFLEHACLHPTNTFGVCCPSSPKEPDSYTVYCGNHTRTINRIVGGEEASVDEWPWMVALLTTDGNDGSTVRQFCGGVLITASHVLTAAHCVRNDEKTWARLGEYTFDTPDETSEIDILVEKETRHPRYNRRSKANDLAILTLERPAPISESIRPICLPPPDMILEGTLAMVTGWGVTTYGGNSSAKLLEVTLPIWTQEHCRKAYNGIISITSTQICAGAYEGGMDSCQGDSGGPLQTQLEDGTWVVVGLVSFGLGCGSATYPGVYTSVGSYVQWIGETTGFE